MQYPRDVAVAKSGIPAVLRVDFARHTLPPHHTHGPCYTSERNHGVHTCVVLSGPDKFSEARHTHPCSSDVLQLHATDAATDLDYHPLYNQAIAPPRIQHHLPTSERLLNEIEADPGFGYKVKGFFDDICPDDFRGKHLGSIDNLEDFVRRHTIHQIFYTYTANNNNDLSRAVKIADDNVCDFYYVPRITRFVNRPFSLNTIGSVPVLCTQPNPLSKMVNRVIKRSFDLTVSGLFLLFYPLIYIPIAIAIKMSSTGPVYFKQERTGYRGNSFLCYKFRTMKINANADKCQATKNDPRKTRVGDFLRRTSLDELPQFINVWKGDMSIVGPRPHMLRHTEEYTELIHRYMVRHMVKPGITGWAQVNGYRGITDELWKMERRVEFDTWYIENWSFFLDLKIMVRTIINAVKGESNAF